MPKQSAQSQLQRLKRLEGVLRAGNCETAQEYATELGVSLRTFHRDLAMLRDEGLAIDGERGRGGGVRLRGAASRAFVLTQDEAVDLLLSLAVAEQMGSPLLLKRLRSIRHKATLAFPTAHVERIRSLRRRILIGSPASSRIVASYRPGAVAAVEPLTRAFFEMRRLQMSYSDERERLTQREVDPHYLHLNVPAWYLLAWDHLRSDVRSFRIDRIRGADVLNASFRLRDPRPFLAAAEASADTL